MPAETAGLRSAARDEPELRCLSPARDGIQRPCDCRLPEALSGSAHEQVEKKLALTYRYLGAHAVKNIAKPVRVYQVQMEPEAAAPRGRRVLWKPGPWSAPALVMLLLVGAGAAAIWDMSLPPAQTRHRGGLRLAAKSPVSRPCYAA